MSTTRGRPGPAGRITDKQLLAAARRYYQQDESQASIARDLNISTSHLARLLASAKARGWVKITVEAPVDDVLADDLRKRFPALRHAFVMPSANKEESTRQRGSAAAAFLNEVLDAERTSKHRTPLRIAIGGAGSHAAMVEAMTPGVHRVEVGPTSLAPFDGHTKRLTACGVALLLAYRLGAIVLGPRNKSELPQGAFVCATAIPPNHTVESLKNFYASLEDARGMSDMLQFWNSADVIFTAVDDVRNLYADVQTKLDSLGVSIEKLLRKGAVGISASQVFTADGRTLQLADGVPAYEPAMPLELMRTAIGRTGPREAYVVLQVGANGAEPARALLESRTANVIICDATTARALLA